MKNIFLIAISFIFFACSSGDGSNSLSSNGSNGGEYSGSYGSVSHGGQSYKTVVIGTQTWMAENLNYNATSSVCYKNNTSNCTTYGRLYNWTTAMTSCPNGWHLPTNAEWTILINYVGGSSTAGRYLKATSGWEDGTSGNGEDTYGFAALPGGNWDSDDNFDNVGYGGYWWSASEYNTNNAYARGMDFSINDAYTYYDNKNNLFSVRCIKD